MDIKINKMFLRNFKGIQALEIYADGENLKIFGDNATGKTTVFDAFTWLLFGKDSLGRSDFGIKTQDVNGNAIHNLEHCVECELAIDNSILTLKKVYAEKWTKKRGSAEAEFSGHETKYFINEVPSTKKEYEQKIASLIDEELFKIITNPLYFNEHLKWQDRRAILLSLCNNLSDEEILAQSDEFSPLREELKGRTVGEYSKIIKGKQTAINDELKAIPHRISEASLAISEATLAIPKTLSTLTEADKEVIEKRIAELNNEIIAIKNGSGATKVEIELKELREQKRQMENKRCDVSELENELSKCKRELSDVRLKTAECKLNVQRYFNLAQQCEIDAKRLREEWHKVNDKQYSESEVCPTCGQPLPAEQIEQAKAKFNTARATALEEINAKGKAIKEEKEGYIATHDKLTKELDTLLEKDKELVDEIARINESISDTTNNFADDIKAELDEINLRIAEAENKAQGGVDDIESKIYPIQEQINAEKAKIAEINKALAERDLAKRQKARIADLEADEKRLAIEYAELDKTAYLIEKFTKYKVDMLRAEVNSHFKYARFKLFEEQINGGIAECCEVTFKGVPYSDLNNAARIIVGIDIINTLCKLNDKYAPVIVDNSESITHIPQTVSQMICLIVSAEDDMLRVEKN